MKKCELVDDDGWRPGANCQVPAQPEPTTGFDPDAEALVKVITDQILSQMK